MNNQLYLSILFYCSLSSQKNWFIIILQFPVKSDPRRKHLQIEHIPCLFSLKDTCDKAGSLTSFRYKNIHMQVIKFFFSTFNILFLTKAKITPKVFNSRQSTACALTNPGQYVLVTWFARSLVKYAVALFFHELWKISCTKLAYAFLFNIFLFFAKLRQVQSTLQNPQLYC